MTHDYDVIVVGGGPVGGWTARNIAKAGLKVAVIEEHIKVGEPVQCAGIITPRVFDMVDFAEPSIINEVTGANIFSPAGNKMAIGTEKVQAKIIDRTKFDSLIMDNAIDAGAELISGNRVTGLIMGDSCEVTVGEKTLKTKLVIGADGAKSNVRSWLGLEEPAYYLNGFGADIENVHMEQDKVNVFFGSQLAPNFFAWMIPAGDVVRVGLCMREGQDTVYHYFKKLFEKGSAAAPLLEGGQVSKTYAGIIPLGLPTKTYANRGMIVGDAASHVKATSGGGIYPGLVCAQDCAQTAIEALEADDTSEKMLANYQKAWHKGIGDELKKDIMIHKVFASLTDEQVEDVFNMVSNEETLAIINKIGDIDYPSRLGWMLLKREKKLLKYAGKFLRYGLSGR
ncbi:MAG: NAD(P)/FAD-dependent oxidoreductase [Thermoplasmata archaeon]|nr:NAD(P)/FAD-dependent oxidoreductase [Thermoplasmata archaeon]